MASELFFSGSLLYYISEWVVRLIMLGIVIERHPLRSAMVWLLVIFFSIPTTKGNENTILRIGYE